LEERGKKGSGEVPIMFKLSVTEERRDARGIWSIMFTNKEGRGGGGGERTSGSFDLAFPLPKKGRRRDGGEFVIPTPRLKR